MSQFPGTHVPNVSDGVEGLLVQIVENTGAAGLAEAGDATAGNQTTEIAHLAAIEAATEGPTPAGNNNIGTVGAKQYSGVPSNFAVATADGTVFTLAAGEIGFIQNLDSADALAVKKGATASTSSFNFILAPGSAADDGKGGYVLIDDWIGVVSVATMTGAGRYIAWKQAA